MKIKQWTLASVLIPAGMFACNSDSSTDSTEAPATAAETPDRCTSIQTSISSAGFSDKVTVDCDSSHAWLTSDTYPVHEKMNGITGTNEQVPVPAAGHKVPIPLAPSGTSGRTTIDGALAVAVNGVPIYDYSSQGNLDVNSYDARSDTKALGQLDVCGGHAGRGDDYHYHAAPECMISSMKNKGASAIIGWAFDGYPIYSDVNPDGSALASGDLDVCNGKPDTTYGYRYHTSASHPYVLQCLVGSVDTSIIQTVSPLSGKGPGEPPRDGVSGLTFTEAADGTRTMSYTWQGASYYIKYKASSKANCYTFEQKTVTNGGTVQTGEYCRT